MMNRRQGCIIALIVPAVFWAVVFTAAWWWPWDVTGEGAKGENYPW